MDVFLHTSDQERRTIPFLKNSRLIRVEPNAMVLGNRGLTMLRAVHEMKQVFHEGLRHCKALQWCRPFRACGSYEFLIPGRCPGLICFGPFGALCRPFRAPGSFEFLIPGRCPGL